MKAIKAQTLNPYIWTGNHSVHSWINFFSTHTWTWGAKYSGIIEIILLAVIFICILGVILQAFQHEQKGINSYLLLVCTIGACLIPSVSHDYKLSILIAPFAILLLDIESFYKQTTKPKQVIILIILTSVLSIAYFSTLFSYTNKPTLIQNNSPALFTMLLVTTFLSVIANLFRKKKRLPQEKPPTDKCSCQE